MLEHIYGVSNNLCVLSQLIIQSELTVAAKSYKQPNLANSEVNLFKLVPVLSTAFWRFDTSRE